MKNQWLRKNAANILTGIRLAGAICLIFTATLSPGFFAIYAIAVLTDAFDGFVARRLGSVSSFGSKLDSAADLSIFTVMMVKMIPLLKIRLMKIHWVLIISTAAVRVLMYLYVGLTRHVLMSSHSYFNKATGFLLAFLPGVINAKWFTVYASTVCIVAVVAALYDIGGIINNRLHDVHPEQSETA